MRRMMIRLFAVGLLLATITGAQTAPKPVIQDDGIWFEAQSTHYESASLTVFGPLGTQHIKYFDADDSLVWSVADVTSGELVDGLYKFELRLTPAVDDETWSRMHEARDAGDETIVAVLRAEGRLPAEKSMMRTGTFRIEGGAIVPPNQLERSSSSPANLRSQSPAAATATHDDVQGVSAEVVLTNADGVIRNSACVGFDCPNSPVFDDSTVLLMENNTRIKFGDTSVSPFPANDWEIEANSSLSGGSSYLGFNDCGTADNDGGCATDLVFAVEAGARSSALFVESDGDVGIGTPNPVLDLHIVTGNTPALRLDQDGSSGFTPQVWDVAGNEVNFFVRDVTGASALPLRIRPGAPSNSLFVDSDGDVGLGTSTPSADLHIRDTGTSFPNDHADLDLEAGGQTWRFRGNGSNQTMAFTDSTGLVRAMMILHPDGDSNLLRLGANSGGVADSNRVAINGELEVTGDILLGGTCAACDGVFAPGYPLESIEEHAEFMWKNNHLAAVGPTPDGQSTISVFQKTTGILQELEKAHIYIEQLHRENIALSDRIHSLEQIVHQLLESNE